MLQLAVVEMEIERALKSFSLYMSVAIHLERWKEKWKWKKNKMEVHANSYEGYINPIFSKGNYYILFSP